MKVRIAAPAKEQARSIDRWWRRNRPTAPTLFAREMADPANSSPARPRVGSPYVERQGVLIRRVLLRKTRNHVYYEIDRDEGVVMIIAVWGAPKGEAPKL